MHTFIHISVYEHWCVKTVWLCVSVLSSNLLLFELIDPYLFINDLGLQEQEAWPPPPFTYFNFTIQVQCVGAIYSALVGNHEPVRTQSYTQCSLSLVLQSCGHCRVPRLALPCPFWEEATQLYQSHISSPDPAPGLLAQRVYWSLDSEVRSWL